MGNKRKQQQTSTEHSPNSSPASKKKNNEEMDNTQVLEQLSKITETLKDPQPHAHINTVIVALVNIIQLQQTTIATIVQQNQEILQTLKKIQEKPPETTTAQQEDASEEKERRRSIVIAGLPETGGDAKTRRQNCKDAALGILNALDVESDISAAYRMGRPGEKARLMKVVLPNSAAQRDVLKKARELRDKPEMTGIYVRPSLTPAQLDFEYNLRKELRERRAKGERCRIVGGGPGNPNRRVESEN
jgi:hypothetical protein